MIQPHKHKGGEIVSARSQLDCCFALGKYWFFAGNAYKPMSDLRTLELDDLVWCHVNKN